MTEQRQGKGGRCIWKRCRRGVLCSAGIVLLGLSGANLLAQAAGPSPTASTVGQSAPATSKGEAPKQETDRFRLSRERYEKAVAYSRAGYAVHFLSVTWGIVVLVALLNRKVITRLRDFAEAWSKKPIWQAFIFIPALVVMLGTLQLPVEIYRHRLSLKYEQTVQGWGSWYWDWAKGEMIGVVFGLVAGGILFAAIRRRPRTWWLHFWLASIPLVVFVAFVSPWVLDPVFNTFRPLAEKHADFVNSIEKLTERAGTPIPPERMFLMEASQKTNEINAYVTGIGASKRIVVWDNTINKMPPDEVLFIVGHEMGHYALGHVAQGIAFALAGIFLGFYVSFRALRWLLKACGERWGVRGQQDWAALAVLLLIGKVVGFLAEPVGNGFSRRIEHEADVYGLEAIHGIVPNANETAAHAFQTMGELDLADPNPSPFITIWLYSHPPLADRLEFAHNYNPWDKGELPKYVK